MKTTQATLLAILTGLTCGMAMPQAWAQMVYRCGSNYSQTPCKGAVTVDISDGRTAAQRHEAQKIMERNRKAAKVLETERLQQKKKAAAQDASARKEAEKRKLTAQGAAEPVQAGHQVKKKPKKPAQP
jgi:hypothetical protein